MRVGAGEFFVGPLGVILSVLGTALVSGVVLVEIAGAGGTAVENVLAGGIAGMLATLAGLGFFVGWLLFALGTMRARAFPRGAGLLLMVGGLVFGASSSAGVAAPLLVSGQLIPRQPSHDEERAVPTRSSSGNSRASGVA